MEIDSTETVPPPFVKTSSAYKRQVSSDNCTYVDDFKTLSRTSSPRTWTPLLLYNSPSFNLTEPLKLTQRDLKEIPCKPMVVTVEELPV